MSFSLSSHSSSIEQKGPGAGTDSRKAARSEQRTLCTELMGNGFTGRLVTLMTNMNEAYSL